MNSDTIAQLADALAKAQGEMKNAAFNRVNPHFKSKYADLAAVRDATVPALNKHGLCLTQYTTFDGQNLLLHTKLLHSSGEWMESVYPLPFYPDKPQAMGSATTYAKRYCWAAMCGIAADDDDDANAAQAEGAKTAANGSNGGAEMIPNAAQRAKQTRDEWKDRRLGKVAWTAELGAFVRDLEACSDSDQLAALLQTEEAQRLIRECREWARSWYDGKDDIEGLGPRIVRLQTELANRGDAWEPGEPDAEPAKEELTEMDAG